MEYKRRSRNNGNNNEFNFRWITWIIGLHPVRHVNGHIQKAIGYGDEKLCRKFLAKKYLRIINLELVAVAKGVDEITQEEYIWRKEESH